MIDLRLGDCLEIMKELPDNSVDAVITDPPYYKVKDEAWDRQWDNAEAFISWIGELCEQWQRILKPNGSLYMFAWPKIAARVEMEIGKRFNVLNHIVWAKPTGRHGQADKEALRCYFTSYEAIIFAEHYGADNIAKGEAGYGAKCDELRGFVFEPLRAYLDGERERAGVTREQVNAAWQVWRDSPKGGMASHWFSDSQWALPTAENYEWLRGVFAGMNHGGEYLRREYEYLRREYEDLRREYEDLRREYEDLRRPFSVTPDVPYTDVWTFPTVSAYAGKHPCEKPADMMQHIVKASTKPDAVVLDCFMGSGVVGDVCQQLGRSFIGIEIDPTYFAIAEKRIHEAQQQPRLMEAN